MSASAITSFGFSTGFDLGLDLFPLLAAVLSAICCGLLGNFLVLRRLSLMGDAISHSVLPGLVIAFLVVSTRSPLAMFVGAALAGVATVVLVEAVRRFGRVEPGAAMGVVFSVFFALGVLLIERASLRHIDLDADCVLYGQLETLVWYSAPASIAELWSVQTLAEVPRQVWVLMGMCVASVLFVIVLFKELRVAAFDPALATSQGYNASVLHYVFMVFVAGATVASFEAVGSILVIAMLVCPAATARLCTDRLALQVLFSVVFAVVGALGGYGASVWVPSAFDLDTVSAAGSIAVFSGVLLTLAIVCSPAHGVLARSLSQHQLTSRIGVDDLVAAVYRLGETGVTVATEHELALVLGARRSKIALRQAAQRGYIERTGDGWSLSPAGQDVARSVVRRHRLWEHYLVDQAGVSPDHVHETAERLEHLPPMPPEGPAIDPHGKSIPSINNQDRV